MNGTPVPVVVLRSAAMAGSARVGRLRPAAVQVGETAPSLDERLAAARAEARSRGIEEGLAQGREEGRRAGFEAGLEEGSRKGQGLGRESLQAAVQEATAALRQRERQLQQLAGSLQSVAAAHVQTAEDELVALAFETVARLLGPSLCTPDGVRLLVAQLLAQRREQAIVAVHVHPDDAASLHGSACGLPWRADPAVAGGGCVIRHAAGALDARLDTILQEVRDRLLAARIDPGAAA